MSPTSRLHLPTVLGRLRADLGLLLLVATVGAATVAMMAAVDPLTTRSADAAVAAAVRDAGPRGTVLAMLPDWYDDPSGPTRDPGTVTQVRQDADLARQGMPAGLRRVLRPGVVTVTSTSLQLLDAGPGRYLQLAFVEAADGGPGVSYAEGAPPRAGPPSAREPSVQVAVSAPVAQALGLEVGTRVPARDEHGRTTVVEISGVFVPDDPGDVAWQVAPQLLQASTVAGAEGRASATALVPAESLADLRLVLPGDAIRRRVVFAPRAEAVTWRGSQSLERTIAALQSGAGTGVGDTAWDSLLGTVLREARTQVGAARGQAQVLLLVLLASAVLALLLAGQLLVRRRTGSLLLARQRGASLAGIAGELVVESLVVTAAGAAAGLAVAWVATGSVGWAWSAPVLVASSLAPAVLAVGVVRASGTRAPANRSVRRARARAAGLRRLGLEVAVVAAAGLSWVALQQRGVVGVGDDGGGEHLTAASTATWLPVLAGLVLVRAAPPLLCRALRLARRSRAVVPLLVSARLVRSAFPVLPVVVVVLALAGATFAAAFAATLRDGQAAGTLAVVGGDARLDARPDAALATAAGELAAAPGVRAVAAGRVEDGVRVSARGSAESVRLVVVDATTYGALVGAGDLADASQLARLRAPAGERVPALLLGGPPGLTDDPSLRWEDTSIPLEVVGTAPDVGASGGPVVVLDRRALESRGLPAEPDTLWAVGPGSAAALESVVDEAPGGVVLTYAGELDRRRGAALPSALGALAGAACVLLPVLALLATALSTATGSPARRTSLGRLRALGATDRDLRRVLLGEVVVPVGVAAAMGVGAGIVCAHALLGALSLQRLTLAPDPVDPVVPWWTVPTVAVLLAWAAGLALLEWRRVRRTPLARLLRT
ncbi:putative ABC transport system permease protein [Nocardioides cavernae]|uniref:Putative ABC transport system permease protein n=1 Tax=Nocardioides cavernae TaxID=1921566 RepID=A0A7Y9H632_9ACTN|nr:FtsX-like permease family protein [Nocardioides cavernae]NYE38602.1 putative ABC transport system permease protein [Nocardioides cavernae]